VGDVLVLCYHAVSPTWNATFSVPPETLEHQLSHLVRAGWRGATFSDAVLDPLSPKTLAVTFDDGFASVFDVAEPILTRLGLRGTVFAPTAFMGERQHLNWQGIEAWRGTPHADELRCMTWDELGQLADRGWEIGSHTCSHPHLTTLSDEARRTSGIRVARSRIPTARSTSASRRSPGRRATRPALAWPAAWCRSVPTCGPGSASGATIRTCASA
jgi:peptidoglycan/xylan/chitin deacetylase (PgdA/CDA1 family)